MAHQSPVTAILVGGGHRSFIYASYAQKHPDELKIVGIADPDINRCRTAAETYGFGEDMIFSSAEELAKHEKLADAVINGTMDKLHVKTSVPLLEKGYDILLEKHFAANAEEMNELVSAVKKYNRKVMVCHVLRYAKFYNEIKKVIASGKIGRIINIQTLEDVSYHHLSTSYIRGKWANSDVCGTSMLLAKCCHDIDIITWLMSETKPVRVSSFGSLFQFKRENAPEGSADKCMDCKYADSCNMSAKTIYLEHPERWTFYVWSELMKGNEKPTLEQKEQYLRTSTPYGKCAYKSDNNVVDHQSVLINFESGATATHNMTGGTPYSQRRIKITGTLGSIEGCFEDSKFTVYMIEPKPESGYTSEEYDLTEIASAFEGHGGGDMAIVEDFVKYVRGEKVSIACTCIFDSVLGHECVFAADESMLRNGESIEIK